jgi:hypothetical protein
MSRKKTSGDNIQGENIRRDKTSGRTRHPDRLNVYREKTSGDMTSKGQNIRGNKMSGDITSVWVIFFMSRRPTYYTY